MLATFYIASLPFQDTQQNGGSPDLKLVAMLSVGGKIRRTGCASGAAGAGSKKGCPARDSRAASLDGQLRTGAHSLHRLLPCDDGGSPLTSRGLEVPEWASVAGTDGGRG